MNAYTNITGSGFLPTSQNPTYDPNGNLLTGPIGGDAAALSFDKENRLRSITVNNLTTTCTYDAHGRLVVTTSNSATDNRERYTWVGWTLLSREIFTGSTPTSRFRYTWGLDLSGSLEGAGGVGGLLAIERNLTGSTTWDIRYPHCDANGNIISLTDSTGNVSARYRYDAFGKVLSTSDLDGSNWATHNIHGFSSKPTLTNTRLLYYGYRLYDPTSGRWINRDPIEEEGGLNLYGMVGNDPLLWFDYLGMDVVCVYRWVYITYFNHKTGNRDNKLGEGDYATSDSNPKERGKNDSCGKKSYYPSKSIVHEFGDHSQDGQISDSGDGGRVLTMPPSYGGTLPYGSWLDRWTDNPDLVSGGKSPGAYWAKVLICWDKVECPCAKSPAGAFEKPSYEQAVKDIEASDSKILPVGPNGKPSVSTPPAPVILKK